MSGDACRTASTKSVTVLRAVDRRGRIVRVVEEDEAGALRRAAIIALDVEPQRRVDLDLRDRDARAALRDRRAVLEGRRARSPGARSAT